MLHDIGAAEFLSAFKCHSLWRKILIYNHCNNILFAVCIQCIWYACAFYTFIHY
jgi:hypothetical protein